MAGSLKTGFYVSGPNEIGFNKNRFVGACSSMGSLSFTESNTITVPALKNEFQGTQVIVSDQRGLDDWSLKSPANFSVHAQASLCVSRSMRWWEKTLKSNMIEINSAQVLVDSLLNAGDKLVIIDFYSPGCGGCKALHPKICQFAESNPNALFFKVNYEELKPMCYSLNIHVLPFFRFYRGAEGRLCSFSCTNATIKKFKDALAKHRTERCSLGPAKGLEETELLKLAEMKQISFDLPSRSINKEIMEDLALAKMGIANSFTMKADKIEILEANNAALVV
ncbi:Thioredoxin [Macleaya cordata]|uniref:Thioredoxin n=1 Tax=Macleaya cordata TaxID=56857 RepID=A0A200QNZ5_MACCD|nr:Thioredoxin [Macleaya cordata]